MEQRFGEVYELDRALQCLKRTVMRHYPSATGLNIVAHPDDGRFIGAIVADERPVH